jgi:hypothetical protein
MLQSWLLVYFVRVHATFVAVSSYLCHKYLITLHVSAQLAIFRCTVWFVDLLKQLLLLRVLSQFASVPPCTCSFLTVLGGRVLSLVRSEAVLRLFVFSVFNLLCFVVGQHIVL